MALEQAGGQGILHPDIKRSADGEAQPGDAGAAVKAADSQTRHGKAFTKSEVQTQQQQVCHMHKLLNRMSTWPHLHVEKVCCCLQVI